MYWACPTNSNCFPTLSFDHKFLSLAGDSDTSSSHRVLRKCSKVCLLLFCFILPTKKILPSFMFYSQYFESDSVSPPPKTKCIIILNMFLQTTLPTGANIFAGGRQPWPGTPEAEAMWRE